MEDEIEIILRAVDETSSTIQSVISSALNMGNSFEEAATEASEGFNEIDESASETTGTIQDIIDYCQEVDGSGFEDAAESADELGSAAEEAANGAESAGTAIQGVDGSGFNEAAGAADDLEREVNEADQEVQQLNNDLGIINSGMLLQTADQIKGIGASSENMAQGINTASISVGQLATMSGIAEPQMVSLINHISNATFPNDEAMLYVQNLVQIGVSSENLGTSATNLDKINDAFGLGADMTARYAQELSVLGVDMNHVETAYNALAYANANTVGGMDNFFRFLQKYDAQFKELGLDVDQSAVLISAATKKFGGGKAAFSGLGEAIKGSNGDLRELEKSLDLAPGSLDHATEATAQYEGQLEELASEEMEHKTLLDHIGAAWEDLSLSLSPVLAPLASAIGLIGQLGGFGLQVNGLKQLASLFMPVIASADAYAASLFGLTAAEEAEAAAEAVATSAKEVEVVANEEVAASATTAGAAEGLMLWPLLLIIAAIVALVAIVYEVGKAFGWWEDIPGMLSAIWDGLQRMWDAFINHPDVQAAIQAITSALQWLWQEVQKAGQAVLEFFGINSEGNFDIVRTLIDSIGAAWNSIRPHIIAFIDFCIQMWNAMEPFRNILMEIGSYLAGELVEGFMTFVEILTTIWTSVSHIVDLFQQYQDGQISLTTLIISVWNTLQSMFGQILSSIIQNAMRWASQLWNAAVQAASGFVSNIIKYVMMLPLQILAFLDLVKLYIIVKTTEWVNQARAKASQLVSQVISYLSRLPGRALSALLGVVSAILRAGAQWVSNAKAKASEVVNGAASTLGQLPGRISSALSGVVNAIVAPFRQAYDTVKGWWDKIVNLANNVPHPAAGGEAYGGEELLDEIFTDQTIQIQSVNDKIEVDGSLDFNFNIDGLPETVDTNEVLQLFKEFFSDKTFKDDLIKEIATSKLFQKLDSTEKNRLSRMQNRARGV